MFWILFGVLFVLFVRNNFNVQGVAKDIRKIAKVARKIARDLAHTVRQAVKDGKKEAAEARKAAPEQAAPVAEIREAPAAQPELQQQENELLKDLELHARTAAMMVNVPTLAFPEDDPKYDSSKKYMYA